MAASLGTRSTMAGGKATGSRPLPGTPRESPWWVMDEGVGGGRRAISVSRRCCRSFTLLVHAALSRRAFTPRFHAALCRRSCQVHAGPLLCEQTRAVDRPVGRRSKAQRREKQEAGTGKTDDAAGNKAPEMGAHDDAQVATDRSGASR